MFSFITLVQGIGLAYAAGLNLYAAVAVTGLAVRYGWITNVPTTIEPFGELARHRHRGRAVRRSSSWQRSSRALHRRGKHFTASSGRRPRRCSPPPRRGTQTP